MMWLWMCIAVARAGVPVVYDGGDAEAVRALVRERSGLPDDEIELVSLTTLLDQPPMALGDAVLRRCTAPPSDVGQVHSELERAEAAMVRNDFRAAQDHLDQAVSRLGCLSELSEPPKAASVFLLRGALEARLGDEQASRSELRTALAFQPSLQWDPRYGLEGRAWLDEERAAPPQATLHVIPDATGSGSWIDGRQILPGQGTISVGTGLHLAQHPTSNGIRSAWIVVAGDSTLVLPGSFRQPVLDAITRPDSRVSVESLLDATIPELRAAYVVHKGGVWLVSRSGDAIATTELRPPDPDPVPETVATRPFWQFWKRR